MLGLTVVSSALLLAFSFGVIGGAMLHAAPLVLLVLPLLGGRFVGESAIERLVARGEGLPSRVSASPMTISARGTTRSFVRPGLLLAASLAGRGPPASLLAR